MSSAKIFHVSEYSDFMPVDVFEGGTGNLVLRQEWPSHDGERFLRIMIPMQQARRLAAASWRPSGMPIIRA
jgi:hypothetical protein